MKTPKAELESNRGDDLRHPESFGWKGEVFVSWGRPVVTPFNKVYRGGKRRDEGEMRENKGSIPVEVITSLPLFKRLQPQTASRSLRSAM